VVPEVYIMQYKSLGSGGVGARTLAAPYLIPPLIITHKPTVFIIINETSAALVFLTVEPKVSNK
jgi:hypothetical protein